MDSASRVFSTSSPPLSGGCRALSFGAEGYAPGLTLWLSAPEGEPPAEGWPLLIVLEGEAYFTAAAEAARRLARRPQKTRGGPMMVMGVALAPDAERCIDILSRRVAAAKLEERVRIRALEPQLHRHVLAILL